MRVAVLGVGLIGGSVGLAAKQRLGAEVAGFDPEPETLESAVGLGAVDLAAGSIADAVADAEAVFCAAPVRALPELVAAALASSGSATVVTDVGSTKQGLVDAVAGEPGGERFIGGHPLAGAETAGVANARPDLFEGARWYLTPTRSSEGVLFDRLHGLLGELGARPQAIEPAEHDRIMATVSHLPHVLANALVGRAAELAERSGRLPEVGRSFRDSTRVAGANPAIWGDILASNGAAVANEVEAVAERLREAAGRMREGSAEEIARWQAEAAGERRALLESDLAAGALRELRLAVANRPGVVAEIALDLGRAGINIEDMGLFPAADRRSGAISLWIAGDEQAERAAEIVRALGHGVSVVAGGA